MNRRLTPRTALRLAGLTGLLGTVIACSNGCSTVAQIGAATGVVTPGQAEALVKTGKSFGNALKQITPEQEYYVGRAVGASLVSKYKVYDRDETTLYVNTVGQALAMASEKPETFGGYHYLILNSDEINAFAAPGGLIFLSRGMLRLCKTEDELAAVLAHEVAHVNLGHAISAISNSRWTDAMTVLGTESAKNLGGGQLASLTTAFEGSIQDVTSKLVTSGYARGQERDADTLAIKIMQRLGYDPSALGRVLGHMDHELKPGGLDFAKTHPPPQARIADLAKLVTTPPATSHAARQQRFQRAMKDI